MRSETEVRDRIHGIYDGLNDQLLERSDVLLGSVLAILSRKHVFMIGPPGVAKSLVIEKFCRSIEGIVYFEELISKHSKPEDIFGPIKVSAFKEDRYERNTEGFMPSAHVVFLDEFFKGNPSFQNMTLSQIDERRAFRNGKPTMERTPLMSLFTASNEFPENEQELGALYDRLHFRFMVKDISDDNNFARMMMLDEIKLKTTITIDDLKVAQEAVDSVIFSQQMAHTMADLRSKFRSEGLIFSPRRWRESAVILRAHAWYHGRDEVENSDLSILTDVMWDRPEQRREVSRLVMSTSSPEIARAIELLDQAREIYDNLYKIPQNQWSTSKERVSDDTEAFRKIMMKLRDLPSSPKIDEILAEVEKFNIDVHRDFCSIDLTRWM